MTNDYLSIGKIAKLKNVSIKSLRYYDSIGIFRPAFVNPKTNYRYYKKEQLPVLDAILLCLELGIPLKDLHSYTQNSSQDNFPSIDFEKLLIHSQQLAQKKIENINGRLNQLETIIKRLHFPEFTECTFDEPQNILVTPLEDFITPQYYGQYILKLFVLSQQLGITVAYPSGVYYQKSADSLYRYLFLFITSDITSIHSENIRQIPVGTYYRQNLSNPILETPEVYFLPDTPPLSDYDIFEMDILEEDREDQDYLRKLLIPKSLFSVR